MRQKVFGKKLNRDTKERKALFKSLITSFIKYGKIKTTSPKAKAIRGLVEKLVTKAKDGSSSALHQISSFLNKKDIVNKLVSDVAPRFKDKLGGYIRIIKLGKRQSDNAQEVIMEWSIAEKKEIKLKEKEVKKIKEKDQKDKKI